MNMKVKAREIWNVRTIFFKIMNTPQEAKLAYRIAKIMRKLDAELKTLDEQRNNLIKKYGEQKNRQMIVPEPKMPEFLAEFEKVLSDETEFDIQKIPVNLIDNIQITPADLLAIENYIEDPVQA